MEINTSKKHERQRLRAIAYSALALCLVAVCSLTLPYLYSIREEHVPESAVVILVIVTIPLFLNGVQLLSGIILLCLTRSEQPQQHLHYLPNCKLWVAISRYLNVFIFIEMFITFQFFKAMILPFGIQYLARLVAMKKVGRFMEQEIARSLRNAMAREVASGARPSSAMGPTRTPVMLGNQLIATTIVPNNEIVYVTSGQRHAPPDRLDFDHESCRRLTTFGRLAGQANAIHVHPLSIGIGTSSRPSRGRVLVFDDISGELHLQCQRPGHGRTERSIPSANSQMTTLMTNEGGRDGDEDADELPPPSYAEAVPDTANAQVHVRSCPPVPVIGARTARPSSGGFTDAPPSYNEAVKARARLHWRIIAMHRKNQRNRQSQQQNRDSVSSPQPQLDSPCTFPPSSFQ